LFEVELDNVEGLAAVEVGGSCMDRGEGATLVDCADDSIVVEVQNLSLSA